MNARLPNEWRNDLTVGTGTYAAFGKDWVVAIAFIWFPSPALSFLATIFLSASSLPSCRLLPCYITILLSASSLPSSPCYPHLLLSLLPSPCHLRYHLLLVIFTSSVLSSPCHSMPSSCYPHLLGIFLLSSSA